MAEERNSRRVRLWRGEWTPKDCQQNREFLFVFGDNLMKKGKKGQAVIRNEPNTYGIPTKVRPSMRDNAFFKTEHEAYLCIQKRISSLQSAMYNNMIFHGRSEIVFSENGYGNGLARLDDMYPDTYNWMMDEISLMIKYFGDTEDYYHFVDKNNLQHGYS